MHLSFPIVLCSSAARNGTRCGKVRKAFTVRHHYRQKKPVSILASFNLPTGLLVGCKVFACFLGSQLARSRPKLHNAALKTVRFASQFPLPRWILDDHQRSRTWWNEIYNLFSGNIRLMINLNSSSKKTKVENKLQRLGLQAGNHLSIPEVNTVMTAQCRTDRVNNFTSDKKTQNIEILSALVLINSCCANVCAVLMTVVFYFLLEILMLHGAGTHRFHPAQGSPGLLHPPSDLCHLHISPSL